MISKSSTCFKVALYLSTTAQSDVNGFDFTTRPLGRWKESVRLPYTFIHNAAKMLLLAPVLNLAAM